MSQVQCHTRILLVFLFENMVKVQNFLHTFCWLIKSAVFCICHFIPRMFCFFTQHCCCFFLLGSYVVVGQNVWGQLVQQDSKWKVEGERCEQIQSFTFSGFSLATRGKSKPDCKMCGEGKLNQLPKLE